jgi:DNA-directed RNA polymerase II subunit RPB1
MIVAVRAQLTSAEHIRRSSVVHVTDPASYTAGVPRPNGPMDTHMGVIDRSALCQTCGHTAQHCTGHHGHVDLCVPIMHPSHFAVRRALAVLACVCWTCSRLLQTDASRAAIERAQRVPVSRGARFAAVRDACRLVRRCDACDAEQPRILRIGTGSWSFAIEVGKARSPVSVARMYATLDGIPDEDSARLGFLPSIAHPRQLVMTTVAVVPPHVRPAVTLSPSVVNQDDLTATLGGIVRRNALLQKQMAEGQPAIVTQATEQLLAYSLHTWMDGSDVKPPNVGFVRSTVSSAKTIKALRKRIEGKQGLVRQNLMGKRTDFTARTVITGDPHIGIDELGVPLSIANNLTFPDRVTAHNHAELTRTVRAGPDGTLATRGARFVVRKDGERQSIAICAATEPLAYGDIVERQLRNGDIVIFNRQPSLHRMSLMAHRVRVVSHSTFRMNLSCTTPYNADFDGDEMNMHVPQTHEARAEAALLMTPSSQLISPQSNRPVMGIVQDTLLGAALLTSRDTFIDREELFQLLMALPHWSGELPVPAVIRPEPRWTGKQMITLMLPRTTTLTRPAGMHRDEDTAEAEDTLVRVRSGEHLTGHLCKRALGTVEGGLVHLIFADEGAARAAEFIDHIQLLLVAWMQSRPSTVGIADFYVDAATRGGIAARIAEAVAAVAPTDTEDGIQHRLNCARDAAGKIVVSAVGRANNMRRMCIIAGSKGSSLNIAQTIGCVGQQSVDGQRPVHTRGRCLPCFPRHSTDPSSRGFVASAYILGLTPAETFFHAMGGREGLIDTAVKTSETGYTQRRLVKSTEAVTVAHNGTVVDNMGCIVTWLYGDDGLDAAKIEAASPAALTLSRREFSARVGDDERAMFAYDYARAHWPCTARIHVPAAVARIVRGLPPRERNAAPIALVLREVYGLMGLGAYETSVVETMLGVDIALSGADIGLAVARERQIRVRARVTPGEMVGSIAAQSIGEPATQMTLNTFHAAGCAAHTVLLGVPRLKELINATGSIRTPSLTIYPEPSEPSEPSEPEAGGLARRLQHTGFPSVLRSSEVHYAPDMRAPALECDAAFLEAYWEVPDEAARNAAEADTASMWLVRLELAPDAAIPVSEAAALVEAHADRRVVTMHNDDNDERAVIYVREAQRTGTREGAIELLTRLMGITVSGVAGIRRAVIARVSEPAWAADGRPAAVSRCAVRTEGCSFVAACCVAGVDARRVVSNDVLDVYRILGIEAARETLVREFRAVIEADGSYVNKRHIGLLCDVMTYRGDIVAFTRHGLARSDAGFLARCSFEETVEVLFNAALFGDREIVQHRGVTANIMIGQLAPVGTGTCDIILDTDALSAWACASEPATPAESDPLVAAVDLDSYYPSTPTEPNDERNAELYVPSTP